MRTCRPAAIAGQASAWAAVGALKLRSDQAATAGWKREESCIDGNNVLAGVSMTGQPRSRARSQPQLRSRLRGKIKPGDQGASLELKLLMQRGNFNPSRRELARENPHGVALTVDQKGGLDTLDRRVPSEEFRLIGMGREAANGADAGADSDWLAEHLHPLGAVDDLAGECARGGVAHEDHARLGA